MTDETTPKKTRKPRAKAEPKAEAKPATLKVIYHGQFMSKRYLPVHDIKGNPKVTANGTPIRRPIHEYSGEGKIAGITFRTNVPSDVPANHPMIEKWRNNPHFQFLEG